jgi:hypothetical protein
MLFNETYLLPNTDDLIECAVDFWKRKQLSKEYGFIHYNPT